MATFSGISNLFWPRIDRRTAHEIDDDIRDELRFHVDEATDALVASGVELEIARGRVLEKFGDIERVRGACRRVQLGDRIMLQRIQWVVIAVLAFAVIALGLGTVTMQRRELAAREMAMAQMREAQAARDFLNAALADAQAGRATVEELMRTAAQAAEQNARDEVMPTAKLGETLLALAWSARLTADPRNWREAIAVGDEIASKLDPNAALAMVQKLYPEMSLEQRQQIFKPFVFDGGHPMAVQILKLGAFDEDPSVRERAWQFLRDYAFVDFSEHPARVYVFDPQSASAWYHRVEDWSLERIFEDSAQELVASLSHTEADSEAFAKQMRLLMDVKLDAARKYDSAMGEQLERAGLLELVRKWSMSSDERTRVFALRMAGWLDLDSNRLRSEILSDFEHNSVAPTDSVWSEYCNLVGKRGNSWAATPLIEHYRSELATSVHGGSLFAPAMALARIADPNAIPQMIGLLTARDDADNRYAIGYFGLRELTGVAWDESHGAEWWRAWWQQNQGSFAGVTDATIPTFSLDK